MNPKFLKSARIKHSLLLAAGTFAAASLHALSIDTVLVGDAGNPNDSTGYGSVNYDYHIGKYEVTNSQYTAFLNAVDPMGGNANGVYNSNMGADSRGGIQYDSGAAVGSKYSVKVGMGSKPVNYVSFWDAARFSNWLTSGSTETGVYNLGGVTNPTNNTITRDATAWAAGGVAVASENEWYKAAYYQPFADGGDADGYWLYPTQSNSITTADANYANSVGTVTDVGSYGGDGSYYGTFDQGGNVWEWNDAIVSTNNRGLRGGSFGTSDLFLRSSARNASGPTFEFDAVGFRVSSLEAIPEPSTYAAVFGGLVLAIALVRRRGRRTL